MQILIEAAIAREAFIEASTGTDSITTMRRALILIAGSCGRLNLVGRNMTLMVLPGSSCLYGILLFDGPTVVIIYLFIKSGRCCLSRSLALFHELDHDDRSAHLAENHHDKQHDKAAQLLVDQVEGKHAVDESTREEDQAEEDGDGEDADVEALHLGGDG